MVAQFAQLAKLAQLFQMATNRNFATKSDTLIWSNFIVFWNKTTSLENNTMHSYMPVRSS